MKKRTTRIAATLFAATLAVTGFGGANLVANAATIIINDDETAHTYEAYQIFTGKVEENKLTSIRWGKNIDHEGTATFKNGDESVEYTLIEALNHYLNTGLADDADAATVADAIGSYEDDKTEAQTLATIISYFITDEAAGTSSESSGTYTIDGLDSGYYFIKDKDDSLSSSATKSYSRYILQVTGDSVTVNAKTEIPSVLKKVASETDQGAVTEDDNENTDKNKDADWQDAADYSVGDTIAYELYGTLPSNYDSYSTYYYEFVDTLSEGLTFDPSSVVVVAVNDGVESVIKGYTVTPQSATAGANVSIKFENLKTATGATITKDTKIVVYYNATLNEKAYANTANDNKGNTNTVKLVYSNNPNVGGSGDKGTTPTDTVTVFTFTVDAKKFSTDGTSLGYTESLGHAIFTIKAANGEDILGYGQTDENGNIKFYSVNDVKLNDDGTEVVAKEDGKTLADLSELKLAADSDSSTAKIDPYTVEEIKAPEGYQVVGTFTVYVVADYSLGEVGASTSTTGDAPTLTTVIVAEDANETDTTYDVSEMGSVTSDGTTLSVYDSPITGLPSTGDSGRALYYAFGGMVAIAALLYLLREKKNA